MKARFAPSPSGEMHLGNAFCYLLAWLLARKSGAEIVLRVEDLDPQRCSLAKAEALAADLRWLGLDWDTGAYVTAHDELYFQSCRSDFYGEAFARLKKLDMVYPCFCSRQELHAASAPHLNDGQVLYAGTCRSLSEADREAKSKLRRPAYRLKVRDEEIAFTDGHFGPQSYNLARDSGDFIIRRSDGVYAYQLAVVADDAVMGITQVARGVDLLSSTARQLYIYELLGLQPPEFFHLPLLLAPDGRRLAKRDGDLSIAALRTHGITPEEILGHLVFWAGQLEKPEKVSLTEIFTQFDAKKIPKENIKIVTQPFA